MEATNERHQAYQAELSEDSLRLLRVRAQEGASDKEPVISCQLSIHQLSNCPPYVALSYAWHEPLATLEGDQSRSKSIILDGQKFTVTPNLLHALRHLGVHQSNSHANCFWIDALCIDQTNDNERTAQVSIMHRIYRNAEKVLVWLGPDHDSQAYTIREFFRALLQKYYHEDDMFNDDEEPRHYEFNFLRQDDEHAPAIEGLPSLGADIWKAVVRFWDRCWFSRAWVQQEVAFARLAEFWCGNTKFEQNEIVEASRFFAMSGLSVTLLQVRSGYLTFPKSPEGRFVGDSAVRFEDLQLWVRGEEYTMPDDFSKVAQRLVGRVRLGEHGNATDLLLLIFVSLLYEFHRDDASDPRDKIFALLVLMKQIAGAYGLIEFPLEIEYSKSVEQVFRETTGWLIEKTRWLGILCFVQPHRQLNMLNGLPSWVPDYNASLSPHPLLIDDRRAQESVTEHYEFVTQETRPTVLGRCLMVSVKYIGRVADVGDTWKSMRDEGCFELTARLLLKYPSFVNERGKSRIDIWIDTLAGRSNDIPVNADERALFKYWVAFLMLRGIFADFNAGRLARVRDPSSKMPSLELLTKDDALGALPSPSYWSSILPDHPQKAREALRHRPRFETISLFCRRLIRLNQLGFLHCPSAQLLGVAPEDTQAGDEVFQVAGTAMPLVLRRQIEANTCSPGSLPLPQAQVVGEAFVSSFDDIVQLLDCETWRKWQLW